MKYIGVRLKKAFGIKALLTGLLLQFLFMAAGLLQIAQAAPGDLDTSFGTGGKVTTTFSSAPINEANAMAIQADGKIVVAGRTGGISNSFALARYNTDGSLDPTFGTGGTVTTTFSGLAVANAAAVQADGKTVVAGFACCIYNGAAFALARYNTDGSLDPAFGTGGTVTTTFSNEPSFLNDKANAVVLQSDGKIVVAGGINWTNGNSYFEMGFALARYNTDGTLDPTFGTSGKVTTTFSSDSYDWASALAIQADGKIVAAGYTRGSTHGFALARYNSDGTLDSTFGTGGKVTTNFSTNLYDEVSALAIQPDGKIVAAGSTDSSTGQYFALARYNSDGTLDSTFGTGGTVTTISSSGSFDRAYAVDIQTDGKIVAAGRISASSWVQNYDFGLARYNTDGTLDTGFGTGGRVTTDFSGLYDEAHAVAFQTDGRIVAAGTASTSTNEEFALTRYLAASFSDQTISIINFFDTSVSEGNLTGVGTTATSTKGKLDTLKNMLKEAQSLIENGDIAEACVQLMDAYKKTDGNPKPPDFVTGSAAPQLASKIQSLMTSLGCQ